MNINDVIPFKVNTIIKINGKVFLVVHDRGYDYGPLERSEIVVPLYGLNKPWTPTHISRLFDCDEEISFSVLSENATKMDILNYLKSYILI